LRQHILSFLPYLWPIQIPKLYTIHIRTSVKPTIRKKLFRYFVCITAVFIISILASENSKENYENINYNSFAVVFISLVIPAIIGITEGFTTRKDDDISEKSNLDDDL
jgi:hypothetical protein